MCTQGICIESVYMSTKMQNRIGRQQKDEKVECCCCCYYSCTQEESIGCYLKLWKLLHRLYIFEELTDLKNINAPVVIFGYILVLRFINLATFNYNSHYLWFQKRFFSHKFLIYETLEYQHIV